jgi:LuxR family transcriptional regulator, maltose regulon positive regulatory protein
MTAATAPTPPSPPSARPRAAGRPARAAFRPGLVARERLLGRLAAGAQAPLVLLVAPAGYGKTTTLVEWAEQDERPFAWLEPGGRTRDTAGFVAAVAQALEELTPGAPSLARRPARRPEGADLLVQRLARSVAARRRPFVLVVDEADPLMATPGVVAALDVLVDHLPSGAQVAVATRTELEGLPVARLRAQRRLLELRPADLAMTRAEADALLMGLGLRESDVDLLVRRTEGWPAGLCLAALALREQPDRSRALARFAGDDRFVADYLRDELLAGLSRERVSFLTRTSVLDDLSGPLCDAVLARAGSGGTLRDLARSNVMLVPLDRAEGRYRYHGLFADMLRAELRRNEPQYEAEAHRRASAWHAERGDTERAIHHATAAGDIAAAAGLLWTVGPDHVLGGRHAAVRRWLERFSREQIAAEPGLALTAAAGALVAGDCALLEHWCAAAARSAALDPDRAVAGGDAAAAALRAVAATGGVGDMGAAAAEADAVGGDDVRWRALTALLRGVAAHLGGDPARARAHLERGARDAAVAAPAIQVLCLAQLGVLALDEDDPAGAELCVARARAQVERVGLRDCPLAALVFAASALDRAQHGCVDEAQADLRHGSHLRTLLADFVPWYEAETRVLLARAALRLGDVVGARTLLAEGARLARRLPDAPVLDAWLEAAWERAASFSASALLGPTALTTAELRVLRLLPTHLSFREIAARLHVSANTIKTQAHAVYRKLDASSRTEAVAHARAVGLVDSA